MKSGKSSFILLSSWPGSIPGGSRINLSARRLPAACTPRSVRAALCRPTWGIAWAHRDQLCYWNEVIRSSCHTLFGLIAFSLLIAPAWQNASKMSPSIVFTSGFLEAKAIISSVGSLKIVQLTSEDQNSQCRSSQKLRRLYVSDDKILSSVSVREHQKSSSLEVVVLDHHSRSLPSL